MTGSDGYFKAKEEVVDLLAGRIQILEEKLKTLEFFNAEYEDILIEIHFTEKIRRQIKNSLLWDNKNGK